MTSTNFNSYLLLCESRVNPRFKHSLFNKYIKSNLLYKLHLDSNCQIYSEHKGLIFDLSIDTNSEDRYLLTGGIDKILLYDLHSYNKKMKKKNKYSFNKITWNNGHGEY